MEKKEFLEFAKSNIKNFFLFADTENLAEGENIFNTCNFCDYSTKSLPNSSYDIEEIDNSVLNHVWTMHPEKASKLALFFIADGIASRPGQQRLI